MTELGILFGLFLVLLFIGVSVAFAIGISAAVMLMVVLHISPSVKEKIEKLVMGEFRVCWKKRSCVLIVHML